ncbi:MAG: hypothetical protein A2420_04095 [Candidatus Moranbacteria bacterium RIFOXYC1_FULL_44_13]|nr:MAG: hypothetical protein A2420_04095 [Candidatus Moranbacteria bacterium RIFOXYC1_FULL_44_13]OGI37881.1 MAG: hypothetical protein A2612_02280 [Candidatus Moranbacteria bacterium RIFOXYD1_FULL_44_12]
MKPLQVAIIVPVLNAESTIGPTLKSLFEQSHKFDQLVIVDDGCRDNSIQIANQIISENKEIVRERAINVKIIRHEKPMGLASSYNDGIRNSESELIVTLHSDIIIQKNSLEKLLTPFSEMPSSDIVAATHKVIHPLEIWKKYNFWQKCFFARLVEKKFSGLDGKFDCFRKSALEKIGLFDERTFKNAGEDGDVVYKLKKIGKIKKTEAEIIHLHSMDPNFSWHDIVRKQQQYSESQGILLRLGRIHGVISYPKIFFREILVIGLFIPYARLISILLIVIYAFLYTKLVFLNEYKNKRIFVLPFLNIYLLFISLVYSLRGVIYGKQII